MLHLKIAQTLLQTNFSPETTEEIKELLRKENISDNEIQKFVDNLQKTPGTTPIPPKSPEPPPVPEGTTEFTPPPVTQPIKELKLNKPLKTISNEGFREKIERLTRQRDEAIQFVLDTLYLGAEYSNVDETQFAAFIEETSGEKPYRLVWFNQSGLFGHFEVDSFEEAAKEIVGDLGYEVQEATGSMDKFVLTEKWKESLKHMQEIQKINQETWRKGMHNSTKIACKRLASVIRRLAVWDEPGRQLNKYDPPLSFFDATPETKEKKKKKKLKDKEKPDNS